MRAVGCSLQFQSWWFGHNLGVMVAITGSQSELLLEPNGNNVWTGQYIQTLNGQAITWSLARHLYGPSGPYFVIPLGIFIGFGTTFAHWLIFKVNEQRETHSILWKLLKRFLCGSVGPTLASSGLTTSYYLSFTSTPLLL